jgi:hypothetical protein
MQFPLWRKHKAQLKAQANPLDRADRKICYVLLASFSTSLFSSARH